MRKIVAAMAIAVSLAVAPFSAVAQDSTTHWIVGFAAGGSNDVATRLYAQRATELLGRPFVVENKPGAGGAIGAEYVANAAADGHTLLTGTGTLTIDRTLKPDLAFNVIDSFEPVAQFARAPFVVVVRSGLEVETIEDFVAYLKEHPGELNYGSPGLGTQNHLATEYFMSATGTSMEHIPFPGEAPTMTALIGDQIDVAFLSYSSSFAQIEAGNAKGLAVTSGTRINALPDTPTIAETVADGFDVTFWFAAMAPKGTPPDVIAELNAVMQQIGNDPEVRSQLEAQGFEVVTADADALRQVIDTDIEKWGQVIAEVDLDEIQ